MRESWGPTHSSSSTPTASLGAQPTSEGDTQVPGAAPAPHRHGSAFLPLDTGALFCLQQPSGTILRGIAFTRTSRATRRLLLANQGAHPAPDQDRAAPRSRPAPHSTAPQLAPAAQGCPSQRDPYPRPHTHFSPAPLPSTPSPPLPHNASWVSRPPRWPRWISSAPWPGRAARGSAPPSLHAGGAAARLPRGRCGAAAPPCGAGARGRGEEGALRTCSVRGWAGGGRGTKRAESRGRPRRRAARCGSPTGSPGRVLPP